MCPSNTPPLTVIVLWPLSSLAWTVPLVAKTALSLVLKLPLLIVVLPTYEVNTQNSWELTTPSLITNSPA